MMTTGRDRPGGGPQFNVLAQYTKDFSFENPHAPQSLAGGQQQPSISIKIDVNANQLNENDVEVELKLDGKAASRDQILFAFELVYAGVFRIQNVPQENLHSLLMIECPQLLFPSARRIIASAVRNGGFPPLMIQPVDFVRLYREKMGEMQEHSQSFG